MIRKRPIGQPVNGWQVPPHPDMPMIDGAYARLEVMQAKAHAADLHAANIADKDGEIWTYLPYGPFKTEKTYRDWMNGFEGSTDPVFFAIYDKETKAFGGVASYLRIKPNDGSIEVGHINFAPRLQKTRAATEAIFLMMDWAFAQGYRRFEWKCDALNSGSMAAARRFGFFYEGTFRQATMYKGRNRDTAWFAVIDKDWDALKQAYQVWLDPKNFDEDGRQIKRLSELTFAMSGQ
ncbi:MAG: GNAT family protein [Pseudomonadota bacterium]